jgi:hypothetical protein
MGHSVQVKVSSLSLLSDPDPQAASVRRPNKNGIDRAGVSDRNKACLVAWFSVKLTICVESVASTPTLQDGLVRLAADCRASRCASLGGWL